ncbi:uncharacterized protein G2W53_011784 [Senna tora]|uniref:Uncharacterized protein n=1 Tax=Senna tora TaxID=362788 RepID=A0A834U001_9FABA|nr:uncharacterized protein G2W53_011784 [Senna tora]
MTAALPYHPTELLVQRISFPLLSPLIINRASEKNPTGV